MADDDNVVPGSRAGQGDRDVDPSLDEARDRPDEIRASGHTDMPDFVSGPDYTGEIPRDDSGRAGGDVSES